MTVNVRFFIHTIHNGDNAKLTIFSFVSHRQRMPLDFMTDIIRFFTHTMYNRENAKLRIFSFLTERHCIQSNFMTDTIRFFIPTIHNGENANSAVFTLKLHTKSTPQTTKLNDLLIFSYIECSMETFHLSWTRQQYNPKILCLNC